MIGFDPNATCKSDSQAAANRAFRSIAKCYEGVWMALLREGAVDGKLGRVVGEVVGREEGGARLGRRLRCGAVGS